MTGPTRSIRACPTSDKRSILIRVSGWIPNGSLQGLKQNWPRNARRFWSLLPFEDASGYGDKNAQVEKLWRELFSDPTEWRDHRSDKANPSFPDFKHRKHTEKALWLKFKWVPPWVEEKLATLPPGSIELSTFSRNQQLSRYVRAGQFNKTMELFQRMQRDGNADRFTFLPVLKACANLGIIQAGRHVHAMIPPDFEVDIYVGNTLVDMYAKCGSIEEAERVFNQMPKRDVITYNSMIGGYVKCGKGQKALELFEQMQRHGVDPDRVSFVGVLNACGSVAAFDRGRCAHEEIIRRGFASDVVVGTCLVDMYAKCGSSVEAERVFKQMPTRDVVTWNAMIGGYVKCGEAQKALELFEQMQGQGLDPDRATFVGVFNACGNAAALEVGRRTHEMVIRRGYESDVVVGTCLVNMYAKCGSIEEAERVFKQMPRKNIVTMTVIISGYVKCGEGQKALDLFEQMQVQGMAPDRVTYLGILNACGSVAAIAVGRRAHAEVVRRGYESDFLVGNCLVDMYVKCGSIEEAERVFKQMPTRDVVTWNAMINGCVKCGEAQKALDLFEQMQEQGVDPNPVTFVGVLNACGNATALEVGRLAHDEIIRRGYESDVVVGNCLISMYGKCGSTEEAESVFKQMPTRDVVTLNALIGGYVRCGEGKKALEIFEQMQREGVDPNLVTFVEVLNACVSLAALEVGRRVHEEIIHRGYESDVVVGTCLVDMYAKCGSIEEAVRLFKQMPVRNVVTLNAMISGYVKCGEGQKALELFEQMQGLGVDPDRITFVGMLNACGSLAALELGRRAHEEIVYRGYDLDVVVGNCLVDMYAKCGSIEDAERVFKGMPRIDVVTVTAMISGYVKCGEEQKALRLFELMQGQGMDLNPVTFIGLLNACASAAALEVGRHTHEDIIRRGYESDIIVGTCLVDMYTKCGSIKDAENVFRGMSQRDVVTWAVMIRGYVRCGDGQKALRLFEQMQGQGVDVKPVTFLGVLNACASIAALQVGTCVHQEIIRRGYELDVHVGNCLVDMYAKCGSIEDSERVFCQMPIRDVITWNALLVGYGIHGYSRKSLETFRAMCKVVEVNNVTFLSLLSACSHGGLVAEGLECFKTMTSVYDITPTVEHFACVVDLLGRAGHLHEAEDLIMSMPMDPNTNVWMALLGACRAHVNVEVGECCVNRLLELEPNNVAAYVLLSNIYIAAGKLGISGRLTEFA